jgi:hypothetical protein
MKFWYIVWREPYTSYDITQSGYFVNYKDKLSDKFSENHIEAKRYTSIGPAISRLGIQEFNNVEHFYRKYVSDSVIRHDKLSDILGQEKTIPNNFFLNGRIDKMYEDGTIDIGVGNADALEYILNKIKNIKKGASGKYSTYKTPNIVEDDGEGDFWDGF